MQSYLGEILALTGLIFFALNVIITPIAAQHMQVRAGFMVSLLVNILLSGALALIRVGVQGEWPDWHLGAVLMFAIAGVFSTYLGRWFFVDSAIRMGAARASAFQVSNPMFTVIIAWVFLGQALSGLHLMATIGILFGLFLVNYRPEAPSASGDPGGRRARLLASGAALALLGSASYAVSNVLRGAAVRDWNEPIIGGFLGAFVGTGLYVITRIGPRSFMQEALKSSRKGLSFFALAGAFNIIGQISSIGAMNYMPVSLAALITLSTPVIVTPVSLFVFHNYESISARTVTGITIVLLGISVILLT